MEPTNEELAQTFDEAARDADNLADKVEALTARGMTPVGLDVTADELVAEQRELARLMRLNAQGARDLLS